MIYRIFLGCMIALYILVFPVAAAQSRVVTRNAATGMVQKGHWATMSEAVNVAMVASFSPSVSACWIEERRRFFFFIPLPARHITMSRTRHISGRPSSKKSFP
jgi:hypothetical protein